MMCIIRKRHLKAKLFYSINIILHLCTFKTPKKLYKDYIRSISMNEFLGLFSSSYQ